MDVENECNVAVPIAIALKTNTYYESQRTILRPGLNRVRIPLTSGDFKTQATDWSHSAHLERLDRARTLIILVYEDAAGKILIDNIALHGGEN